MAQQRQFQMGEGGGNSNDTKLTKIFVGGLAWETQKDTMRRYFEQFGEIVEAVVISDKNTGRSKGYGFVTFKEADAAMRACQNMNPVIDGRRANCNLAFLGAQKPRPPTSPRLGTGKFRSPGGVGLAAPSPQFRGSSSSSGFVHHHHHHQQQQHTGQFPFPYSAYGFSGYSQEGMYPMNYYNHHLYGGQQFSPYMGPPPSSGSTGMFHGYYPYYPQYNPAQSSNHAQAQTHHQGFSFQYTTPPAPPPLQFPYLPHQQFSSQPPPPPILSLPSSLALSLASSAPPSSSSSASTSAATTATKAVVITTTAAEASSNKDGHEAITSSSIKIED
ncbi:hypothetical protein Bca4012_034827 [Brassica carinata]|uniref:RRM domain-containing protein n=1 Tax=Brassica carinata TaxID=52824 RepID=A0A8X7TK11_BRACI|nr:hypothetical protein Bca52824_093645 [Brassica carinata]